MTDANLVQIFDFRTANRCTSNVTYITLYHLLQDGVVKYFGGNIGKIGRVIGEMICGTEIVWIKPLLPAPVVAKWLSTFAAE